jgi:hypothetical protein
MHEILLNEAWGLTLAFQLSPAPPGDWVPMGRPEETFYENGPYQLALTPGAPAGTDYQVFRFRLARKDGALFSVENYTVACQVPCLDLYNVPARFMGYAHVAHANPPDILSSATGKDFPYVLYASRSGENRFALGLENQVIETAIHRGPRGGYLYYAANRVQFRRPVPGVTLRKKVLEDGVFLSSAKKSWFEVTRDYWAYIDAARGYTPNPTPPSAFGPVWCSWLYLTDIDQEKIWRNALAAKELGIRTLILDAGWFCSDTDIPFPDSPLTNKTLGFGRVDADTVKFPNLRGLVDKIHGLGLYVWAWATPRWVFKAVEEGPEAVDPRLLGLRITNAQGAVTPLLCTRCPDTWAHAAAFTAYLLKTYDFDGLKFDCWELDEGMATCQGPHPHACDTMGEGTLRWAEAIYRAMTAQKPEAVVWFNNTSAKAFSNYSVSPNEVYCQPDENWRMSVVLKTMTNGIVSQLSEGSFHPEEADPCVARHLAILMMGHTPELQVDLTALRPSHRRLVAAWFRFYAAHQEALHLGAYTPFGFEHTLGGPISTTPPHVRIQSGATVFLFLGPLRLDPITLGPEVERVFLFNLQTLDGLSLTLRGLAPGQYRVVTRNCFLEPEGEALVAADGALALASPVAAGGLVEMERMEA